MTEQIDVGPTDLLSPYVPRLAVEWLRSTPEEKHREVEGSLAFIDISGFTKLTERLARLGRVGAEEMSDALNATFAELLAVAYEDGASLVKWGGDAVLLLFDGPEHAPRACRAAHRMRSTLRTVGKLQTGVGKVTLRMSVGIHSGSFDFFLVGDPAVHRELIVSGPAATRTAQMEKVAEAGQIGISSETALMLDPLQVGAPIGDGYLLRSMPQAQFLPAPQRGRTQDVDLASMLPPPLRDRILAGPGTAEHRVITVAFVEFSGTDALRERAGPDALAEALDECVRSVQGAVGDHDVTFFESDINADGGKFMLTAGAPATAEHDEERMLRTARRIIEQVGVLPLRIGVNRGPVFAGDFGPPFRRTFSVKGDAINLAARVMSKAALGQVLATREVVERSRTTFDLETLPAFTVKGKRHLINAVSVGRILGERRSDEGAQPFIGREAEMAVLNECLADAKGGHGHCVVVTGEPGIGKSRLVAEVARSALGFEVLAAASGTYESTSAYSTVRTLLREALGVPLDTAPEGALRLLNERISASAPWLVPWIPALGPLLDVHIPDTPETAQIDVRFRKARLEDVSVQVFAALLPDPTLIVIEDAHHADDASSDVLVRLTAEAAQHPWLLLCTRRARDSGFHPRDQIGVRFIAPAPLDEAQALALIAEDVDRAPLSPHVMEALVERARGNPFFLRTLVAAVQDSAAPDQLPDSLESLLNGQIDALPVGERAVLRYASVLGKSFTEADLRALLIDQQIPSDERTLHRLGQFVVAEGHGRFRFQHALLRDAAYAGLPVRRRRVLHGRAADHFEAVATDLDERSELLSLHYFEAGRMDDAWRYSRIAARRALEKYSYPAAVQFLTRATKAAKAAALDDPQSMALVYRDLGDAELHVGELQRARLAYRASRRLVGDDSLETAELLRKEALVEQRLGHLPVALRTLTRALKTIDGAAGKQAAAERARIGCSYARCREFQGRYREAVRWGGLAEEMAAEAGDHRALAEAYEALHSASSMAGFDQPRPYGRLALDLFDELGDREGQSRAMNNLGVLAWFEGRGDEALEMFERSQHAATAAGDTLGAAATAHNVGDVLLRQGKLREAEEVLAPLVSTFRGLGSEDNRASSLRWLGLAAVRAGRIDEGRALIDEARDVFVALGLAAEVAETDTAVVELLLAIGDAPAAEQLAADATSRAERLDAGYLLPALHRLRGTALLDQSRNAEAVSELEEGLRAAKAQGAAEAGFILGELAKATATSDPTTSEAYGRRSADALLALGYVATP